MQYISAHGMHAVDTHSRVRPGFVPAGLAAKFDVDGDVQYYASPDGVRWVGVCSARNSFAVSKTGVAVMTGELNVEYPALHAL